MKPSYHEGSTLPYLGKSYPIKIFKGQPKNSISFVEQQFMIKLQSSPSSSTKDHSDLITKLYHGWLMRAARPIFKNKIEETSSKLDIDKPKKIGIKKLKNRWASLTPSGTINLNVNLRVYTKGLRGFSGIAIGGIVGLNIFFLSFISGASMNPARSLAPALVSGSVSDLWLYWSATFVGTMIIAFALRKKMVEKMHEEEDSAFKRYQPDTSEK